MQQRLFGKIGRRVGEIGLGCWGLGGKAYGPVRDSDGLAALRRALELGVDFFDTADIYGFGHSEELVGEAVGNRGGVLVATKAGWEFDNGPVRQNWSADYLRRAVEKSLRRLRRDAIDLWQFHNPNLETIERGDIFETAEKLKAEGKIKHYGISIHVPREGIAAIRRAPGLASVQCIVNLLDQRCAAELFPLAREKNVAVIAREPLACGLLAGRIGPETKFPKDDHRARWPKEKIELDLKKIATLAEVWDGKKVSLHQAALEFVLAHEEISVVIPGAKTPQQLESNLAAAARRNLTPTHIAELRRRYASNPLFASGFYRN